MNSNPNTLINCPAASGYSPAHRCLISSDYPVSHAVSRPEHDASVLLETSPSGDVRVRRWGQNVRVLVGSILSGAKSPEPLNLSRSVAEPSGQPAQSHLGRIALAAGLPFEHPSGPSPPPPRPHVRSPASLPARPGPPTAPARPGRAMRQPCPPRSGARAGPVMTWEFRAVRPARLRRPRGPLPPQSPVRALAGPGPRWPDSTQSTAWPGSIASARGGQRLGATGDHFGGVLPAVWLGEASFRVRVQVRV